MVQLIGDSLKKKTWGEFNPCLCWEGSLVHFTVKGHVYIAATACLCRNGSKHATFKASTMSSPMYFWTWSEHAEDNKHGMLRNGPCLGDGHCCHHADPKGPCLKHKLNKYKIILSYNFVMYVCTELIQVSYSLGRSGRTSIYFPQIIYILRTWCKAH